MPSESWNHTITMTEVVVVIDVADIEIVGLTPTGRPSLDVVERMTAVDELAIIGTMVNAEMVAAAVLTSNSRNGRVTTKQSYTVAGRRKIPESVRPLVWRLLRSGKSLRSEVKHDPYGSAQLPVRAVKIGHEVIELDGTHGHERHELEIDARAERCRK